MVRRGWHQSPHIVLSITVTVTVRLRLLRFVGVMGSASDCYIQHVKRAPVVCDMTKTSRPKVVNEGDLQVLQAQLTTVYSARPHERDSPSGAVATQQMS